MTLPRLPAPIVLAVAAVVLIAGSVIGFRLLTAAADVEVAPTCEDQTVAAGDPLPAALVPVDVFNASQRAGLANRVSINLQRRGFLPGQVSNSDIEVESSGVTIVTATPEDDRVRLVAAQFGSVEFQEPAGSTATDTVVVVVGNDTDEGLADDAPTEVEASADTTVCVPIVPEVQ